LNSHVASQTVKDYSLAISLFVFGLFLFWLAYDVENNDIGLFVLLAGICAMLASFVSVAFMRFFRN
jgi:hypothetical protein